MRSARTAEQGDCAVDNCRCPRAKHSTARPIFFVRTLLTQLAVEQEAELAERCLSAEESRGAVQ